MPNEPTGHWFEGEKCLVVMRGTGQTMNDVMVLEPEFVIDTPDLGRVTVPAKRIKTIVFKNLPAYPTDMIHSLNGSELNGTVLTDPIRRRSEEFPDLKAIPTAKVPSIVWWLAALPFQSRNTSNTVSCSPCTGLFLLSSSHGEAPLSP
jgi:hypothetical protein